MVVSLRLVNHRRNEGIGFCSLLTLQLLVVVVVGGSLLNLWLPTEGTSRNAAHWPLYNFGWSMAESSSSHHHHHPVNPLSLTQHRKVLKRQLLSGENEPFRPPLSKEDFPPYIEIQPLPTASSSYVQDPPEEKPSNPFAKTHFDPRYPVHQLCNADASGNQSDELEWGEGADKLLALLGGGVLREDGMTGGFYNMFAAPGQVHGTATNVSVAIYIESMSSFRTRTMDFEVDMYIGMGWYDRRLAHNCTHPILIRHKFVADRLWVPDLYFLNSKFAYLQEVTTPNFMMIVYPDGLVFKAIRADVTLSCMMDLQLFPMDKQECPIVIQSYAYIENLLNLTWHVDPPNYPIARNPDLRLNDMVIVGMKYESCAGPYAMFRGQGNWACIKGLIVMRRLVLFHVIQTYLPSSMLVAVSWTTFWLDPRHSPARTCLTITSLLTLTTMTNGARQDLPQVSYVKAMDVWQTFSQAIIFLVLLEYSFVNYFVTRLVVEDCEHRAASDINALVLGPAKGIKAEVQRLHSDPATTLADSESFLEPRESFTENTLRPICRLHVGQETRLLRSDGAIPPLLVVSPQSTLANDRLKREGRKVQHRKKSSVVRTAVQALSAARKSIMQLTSASIRAADEAPKPCKRCQWLDEQKARRIDRYSRLLFPTAFILFSVWYWLYYGWWLAEG